MTDTKDTDFNLLDHLDSAVIWLSPALKLKYANPAAEMLLDQSLSRLSKHSIQKICKKDSELLPLLIHARDFELSVTRREFKLKLASGKSATVNLTISYIHQMGLIVEMQSIARARAIHNENKLQRDHTAMQKLIRGLAHEVKNPLGGIRGAAQLLKTELASQPELEEYTEVLIKEADRLTTLIDQISGPRARPNKVVLNIHEIAERVRKLIKAEAKDNVVIRHYYDPSLPQILADKDQLIQATLNLARNALESIQQGGDPDKTPTIIFKTTIVRKFTIGHTVYPLVIALTIEDNGPGIPEPLQPQIFFPMVTDKPTGTGLGLPTSRTLIDAQGGIIRFKSNPGKTEFEILLPAAAS